MKVFRKYTLRSLLKNKVRTTVTIIGIALSTALLTAVLGGFMSARQYAIDRAIKSDGSYELYAESSDKTKLHVAAGNPKVKKAVYMYEEGFSLIGSANEYKPYLYVAAVSDDFTDLVSVNITEGRLPQSPSEIILPVHLAANGKVSHKIGDTITVNTGKRIYNGTVLRRNDEYIEGEELTQTTSHTYTVVGFYERFSYEVEAYSSPGYMALTYNDSKEEDKEPQAGAVFMTMKNQRDAIKYSTSLAEDDSYSYVAANEKLLSLSGISLRSDIIALLGGFMLVLMIIIIAGSAALIYNSFSISINERTRQFGILKSVGATRRQILGTVAYEVMYLCVIAIPAGFIIGLVGIGTTLYGIKDIFDTALGDYVEGVSLSLYVRPWMFVCIAALGLITTFISALVPAVRAMCIEPVDAIRGRYDIRLKAGKLKTSKLAYRLFGFPGMLAKKNFKRAKRKYRSTVISLCVSVALFVSTSSYIYYLMGAADTVTDISLYDVSVSVFCDNPGSESKRELERLSDRFSQLKEAGTMTQKDEVEADGSSETWQFYFNTDEHEKLAASLNDIITDPRYDGYGFSVRDVHEEEEMNRALELLIKVFAYGFIILISLIAMANVFNTISTNIMIRRGELAMLKSVGMSDRQLRRMMYYECILYGIKGLAYGMAAALIITYALYLQIKDGVNMGFCIPPYSILISVAGVFAVVFATMLYSVKKIGKDNTVETLKNENI